MHGSLYDFANLTITYYLLLFKEAIFSCGVVVALVRIVKVRWALVGAFFDELGLLHIHLPIRGTFSRHLITTSYSLESMFEDVFFDIHTCTYISNALGQPATRFIDREVRVDGGHHAGGALQGEQRQDNPTQT